MAKKNPTNQEKEKPDNTVAGLTTGGFIVPGNTFDDTEGELFAGLNILRLKPEEAAGPFTLKEILKKQDLGKGGAKRQFKPVDIYVASFNKTEIRMPIAAAFVKKAQQSGLKVGDTFYVKRVADYVAKQYSKANCADYQIKITVRA
jgi:hypothetical protein